MNSCEFYQELISRMLDDELSNNERSVLAEHLYMCDECAAMYSAFSMVSDMVAADLAEPPEELAADVMAHIRRAEIRKRNRRNTRATKNAIAAAACVAFVVAAVGGVAVVRNHRSDNVVYESRMSQSTTASSAKDGSYDAVIVSEAPVVQENESRYVAPVEKYVSETPQQQQQEEKPSFFASILPDSWFTAAAPAPTQPPVVYATPVATPYAQDIPANNANSGVQSNMPAVVVVSPSVTDSPLVVISPAPTQAPANEFSGEPGDLVPEVLPVVTEAPAAEALPVVTEAPAEEALPVVTEAPVEEALPVVTEAPAPEIPAVTASPAPELSFAAEVPAVETPAVTEAPMMELPSVNDAPVQDFAPVPELPSMELPMEEQFDAGGELTENILTPQESFAEEMPMDSSAAPAVANHDFSMKDCTEFVDALFSSKKTEEAAPVQEAEPDAGQTEFASYVDKLMALKAVELCNLPENMEAQRVETLSFSAEGQVFTVQVSFFGEEIYVQSFTGDGSPVSFITSITAAEYDNFVALCYTFDGNL